jgi:hypothetical protein
MAIKHEIRAKEGGAEIVKLTPLRAIRKCCLECVYWSPLEVKQCTSPLCPLFRYRFGRNPERKGLGGKNLPIRKN